MKAVVVLLLVAAGALFYFYKKTDHLDPYLAKYAPALLEAKGGSVSLDEFAVQNGAASNSFLELKSIDGRSINASVISRGPVGVRIQRVDGKTFEIPFEKLDSTTVAVLNSIQTFPHP